MTLSITKGNRSTSPRRLNLNLVSSLSPNPEGIPALHEARGRFYGVSQSGSPELLTLAGTLSLRAEISRALSKDGSSSIEEDPGLLALLLERAAQAVTLTEN